jgi:hypothetical protein
MIHIWEVGKNEHLPDKALIMLAAAHPDMSREALSELTIGQRDGYLLDLYEETFGSGIEACVRCPQCGEHLEITMSTSDIRVSDEAAPGEGGRPLKLIEGDMELVFRLPTTTDLVAITGCKDAQSARRLIVQRCVQQATAEGQPVAIEQLPAGAVNKLAARMGQCDPRAEILLVLECPACGHTWQALFDIVTFLWREISACARRLFMEIHALASAYKWSEADILSMSPARRQFYLNTVT